MNFEDILYEVRNGVAWITINRPEKMNSFRGQTCDEIIRALNKAGYAREVGAIVLAGAGDRAFCTGGDQSAHNGNYDGRGTIGLPMEELHTAIRDVPKPVIAREHARHGITVNVVCPGPTDTALLAGVAEGARDPAKLIEAFRSAIPLGRLGQGDDLASAIAFFGSDDAGFVTGQVLSVSGGLTMHG